jgi:antitoxin CptB
LPRDQSIQPKAGRTSHSPRLVFYGTISNTVTGTTRTTDSLTSRQRRALFRAWHRGMREMDLLLGPFADARIDSLTAKEMDQFEALMEVADGELYAWLSGGEPVAREHDNAVYRALAGFHRKQAERDG